MNGKVAKMLRKSDQSTKAHKRWWNETPRPMRGKLRAFFETINNVVEKKEQSNALVVE